MTAPRPPREWRQWAAVAFVVLVPVGCLVGIIHALHRPDLAPVKIPPPLTEQRPADLSPYDRRILAEKRQIEREQEEYARGFRDGLAAGKRAKR